jgi:hypothetical protein
MRWVLCVLGLVTALMFAAAWVLVDLPTAALGLAAWLAVCGCGAAPVVFSVITRRNDLRKLDLEEAEQVQLTSHRDKAD